jgi:tetratricopeptide (TPR) repeat protein
MVLSAHEINKHRTERDGLLKKKKYREVLTLTNFVAHELREHGRFEEALAEHQFELEVAKTHTRLPEDLILAYRCIGETYSSLGRHELAIKFTKKYFDLTENNPIETQRAYTTLGCVYLALAQDIGSAEASTALRSGKKSSSEMELEAAMRESDQCFKEALKWSEK